MRYLLISLILLTQTISSTGQITDRPPSEFQNHLPIEGGSILMKIDTTTPLHILIGRLSQKWRLIETGKMYWIGYTEDMFSIAARGDEAIEALVKILQSPSNAYAKSGAIYCLHLIGIDRTISGRISEEFVNPKARTTLLQFLKDPSLQADIMRLLIRDPWPSDIPHIIEAMNDSKKDCWALVNGMIRYPINDLPVHQKIPGNIKDISITIKHTRGSRFANDYDFEKQIKEALDSFKHLNSDYISIEDTLFKSNLIGDFRSEYKNPITISKFLYRLDLDYYTTLGSRIQYYVENNKLYICSPETAKKRLLAWWANQSPDEKARHTQKRSLNN